MILDMLDPSGTEQWVCPTCGRRFLLEWSPVYQQTVLEHGDTQATHSGGASDLHTRQFDIPQYEQTLQDEEIVFTDDLLPWLNWMKAVGLASE